MIEPTDPARLRDAASGSLGELMRAAERDVGSAAQLSRLSARLGAVLAPPVAVAAGSAGLGVAAKLGLGAAAIIAAGGGAWLLSTYQPALPPTPSPLVVSAPVAPVAPVAADPARLAPPAVVTPAPVESPQASATPVTPELKNKPVPPAQLSEAELLEQARLALKSDPARALSSANAHAARFPGGALVQEREVIAIKALRQLGRTAEADRRTEAFAKAFPGSAFARKLKPAP